MERKTHLPIPVQTALRDLGRDISEARRRRRITMELMAQRAGFSRITLAKIEKGDSGVSMGAYASVLFVLGMTDHLAQMVNVAHDVVGQELEEENLPKRIRMPRGKQEGVK
jgi:transcriptional regulator with XRE-family HTH domain